MSRASRLEPLADFAGQQEAEAARQVAASAAALQAKQAELVQLRGYLAEYRQQAEADRQGTDSLRWRNARAFLAKLSDAVAFHEAELQKAVERHRLESERWRAQYRRAEALDRVIENSARAERGAALKRDQAELDERNLRTHRSNGDS